MNTVFCQIHPDGWRFVLIFAIVSLILWLMSPTLGYMGFGLTAWCYYFFRNPKRHVPQDDDLVISPADGVVIAIKEVPTPSLLNLEDASYTRVSIFLNVFDVHVNRLPVSGKVTQVIYHPGKFVNASFDKASDDNERNTVVVETSQGTRIAFTQIAGLIARRIRCDVDVEDDVKAGHVYGLIRFGSRMDVFVPTSLKINVALGQRVRAGESIIADFKGRIPFSALKEV